MARKAQYPPRIHEHKSQKEKTQGLPGQARVKVDGEWLYLGPYGSEQAEAKYQAICAQLAQRNAHKPRPITLASTTVGDVCNAFLECQIREHGERSRAVIGLRECLGPLLRLYADLPARQFGCTHLERLQEAMATGSWMTEAEQQSRAVRRQPVGWCMGRVNRMIIQTRAIFRWAERQGMVDPGTWGHLRTVPGLRPGNRLARQPAPAQPTTLEDLEKVKQHCSDAVAVMLELQWLTGMRNGEVRIMRTADLDCSGEVWLYRPAAHKGTWRGQSRVIAFGPSCQRLLTPWLQPDRPDAYLFRPFGRRGHFTHGTYSKAVKRACRKAGVKLTPYGGRYATKERVEREFGLEGARIALGHKKTQTTDLYGRNDLERAKEIAKRMS